MSYRAELHEAVQECTELAIRVYGFTHVPKLRVDTALEGATAGWCIKNSRDPFTIVRFNLQYPKSEIIRNTVPHEIAHAVCFHNEWDFGHGDEWRRVCIELGGNGKRLSDGPIVYKRGTFVYNGLNSGIEVRVSTIRHQRIQNGGVYRLVNGDVINVNCNWREM